MTHKTASEWACVKAEAVTSGSVAQATNVLQMALDDLAALQRFKDFVHRRLDEAGVPTHPDGEHSKAGCRIGDRLDIVLSGHVLKAAHDGLGSMQERK